MGFCTTSCVCLPGDVAELHSNTLRHAPLLRKHASILLLIVYKLAFDPGVAPIDLVQPCNLSNQVGLFFSSITKYHHFPQKVLTGIRWSFTVWIFKFSLTSWFSWNNTRYSERCCLMNFLMISCLMRGSSTLATRQASLSTLLGPPGLCIDYEKNPKHWHIVLYKRKNKTWASWLHNIFTLEPWEGKASSKSARIWVPNSLCAAFTLTGQKTITQLFIIYSMFFQLNKYHTGIMATSRGSC